VGLYPSCPKLALIYRRRACRPNVRMLSTSLSYFCKALLSRTNSFEMYTKYIYNKTSLIEFMLKFFIIAMSAWTILQSFRPLFPLSWWLNTTIAQAVAFQTAPKEHGRLIIHQFLFLTWHSGPNQHIGRYLY